jgi:peptide/nickel transport system substrate-binding protein
MRAWSFGRTRKAAVLLAAGALLASACGSGATDSGGSSGGSSSTTSAGTSGSSSTAKTSTGGGSSTATFVVADTSSVQKLDPAVMTNFLDFQALGLIYQPLVTLNSSLQVEPDLATSWHLSDAGRTLTFDLRPNVKFDDGSAFTSADVKATFERILKPSTGAAAASYLATVKSIATPSPLVVVLHLTRPDSSILEGLTSENLAIASTQSITAGTLATKPDGTGPYKFVSYNPNNTFTVAKNANYWGSAPTVSNIEFKTIPDEQSIASALQAGTVQMGLLFEPQTVDQLKGSNLNIDKELDLNYRALMIQSKTGPLSNVDARLAVQCAINRTDVLQAAVLGDGKVVGPVPEGPLASDASSGTCATQNLVQAKKYLAEAGMAKGFSFSVLTSQELDTTSNAQSITIQGDLSKVGIHMSIDNVAGSDYIQRWLKGDFQAALAENGANPSPYIMYGRYFGTGADLAVPAGYSSSKLASLLTQADESSSSATQKQLYTQFSDELVNNAVWVWLFNAYDYYVTAKSVHGFVASPSGSLLGLASTTVS